MRVFGFRGLAVQGLGLWGEGGGGVEFGSLPPQGKPQNP